MNAIQQHMIDSCRAAQRGEAPPPPGRHDWGVVREARDRRRFDAVIAGRPARRRRRTALRALFTRRRHRTARPGVPGRCGNSSPSGV
ncbi:hypothetical protein ACIQZB_16565 [Streptomyces sp. NPDC097727]|uniref:hypothetical protein n=1 Tax=Streptomyces sp. NPDC097727 TaxID=3366092 RepID=UPI00381BCB36